MIVRPLYLDNWINFTTTIQAPEVRGEFLVLYNLVNGNLDASNLQNASITTAKLVDGSVTNAKITNVDASKITGVLAFSQLPPSLASTNGATYTGTMTFDVQSGTPLINTYSNSEVVLFEAGSGTTKTRILVGGPNALRIVFNGIDLLTVTTAGLVIPKSFKVPGS